jgi:hypothetical protein
VSRVTEWEGQGRDGLVYFNNDGPAASWAS